MFGLLIVVMLLSACSQTIDFQDDIDNMQNHTESFAFGNGDIETLKEDTEAFNKKLNNIQTDDDKIKEFVKLQREANVLRLEALENMDFEKIMESASFQAQAILLYDEIKGTE